jgi:outer membrane protein OmpA-like peptidoglycan-associated protein
MKEVLRNIFFDVDSYMLSSQSKSELRNLLKFLSQNPGVIVEIGGHTDLTGKESHNDQLSQLRAHQVYEHLIANGIPSKQLSYKGYGATMPLSTNNNDQSHSLNRRTEFKIIEIQTK